MRVSHLYEFPFVMTKYWRRTNLLILLRSTPRRVNAPFIRVYCFYSFKSIVMQNRSRIDLVTCNRFSCGLIKKIIQKVQLYLLCFIVFEPFLWQIIEFSGKVGFLRVQVHNLHDCVQFFVFLIIREKFCT